MFNEVCPFYLHIGMTYDQFWRDSPELVVFYREKHRLDRKAKNQELWLEGFYHHKAIVVALNNAFSKKKDKYFEEPLPIVEENEREKEERVLRERQKIISTLNKFKSRFDRANKD